MQPRLQKAYNSPFQSHQINSVGPTRARTRPVPVLASAPGVGLIRMTPLEVAAAVHQERSLGAALHALVAALAALECCRLLGRVSPLRGGRSLRLPSRPDSQPRGP